MIGVRLKALEQRIALACAMLNHVVVFPYGLGEQLIEAITEEGDRCQFPVAPQGAGQG